MGCDIHVYPERRKDGQRWKSVTGRINPGRDYDLFGKIAGLRNDGEPPMFEVRGLPDDLGYWAESDSKLYITDVGGDEYASKEQAAEWVACGASKYTDERQAFVTHPDWHSHTWLTVPEMRRAIEAPSSWGERAVEYYGLIAMMEEVERRGYEARFVIWFDN